MCGYIMQFAQIVRRPSAKAARRRTSVGVTLHQLGGVLLYGRALLDMPLPFLHGKHEECDGEKSVVQQKSTILTSMDKTVV
jgi:hypothetical protein